MSEEKVKLRIYGMTCEDCAATISRGLKDQDGVLDVKIFLNDGTGLVDVDLVKVKPEELLKNIVFSKPSHYRATLIYQ